jgi:hypothetical protein
MAIGESRYDAKTLSAVQRETLYRAARELVDRYFHDLDDLAQDQAFAQTSMAEDLPRKHLGRYDRTFAQRFLVCVLSVAQKLRTPGKHMLACTAEEIALGIIVEEARELVLVDDQIPESAADFSPFMAAAFEDWDYLMLFEGEFDGVEDLVDARGGIVNLRFDEWFIPFGRAERDEYVVHPYLDEGTSDPITAPLHVGTELKE